MTYLIDAYNEGTFSGDMFLVFRIRVCSMHYEQLLFLQNTICEMLA